MPLRLNWTIKKGPPVAWLFLGRLDPPIRPVLVKLSDNPRLNAFCRVKRLDLTVHYLAQSRLERLFEWIYGQIFGSQIAALRSLMAVPSGQMTLADVISYFDNVKSSEGARYQNVSFDHGR